MITCPWCGTNYTVFQSNCKNCGGPLTPLTEQEEPRSAEEPLVPPPAPRPVPDSYIWKLLLPDGWSVAAFVVGLIGIIFSCVGVPLAFGLVTAFIGVPFALAGLTMAGAAIGVLIWRYRVFRDTVRVLQIGEAARGQILNVEQNFSVEINGRHPWRIDYRFNTPRGDVEGRVTTLNTPGEYFQPGRDIYVLFLPENPEINSVYPHP